ncbi:PEP-CTERM/exosortase system-associated acyltransferase [uncultured Paraglaciecola sp.]|uniref:PEP-CTERM/exosortase system-associated acyltransferase n=1 Tax=uncultured Paraglaciecola sp. TaxID=1765024 RepID=UPI0026377BC1|nr:PEP-CTERM/exosortase system-associated acyltransferase [uncultured Paraglaciecola sp.]
MTATLAENFDLYFEVVLANTAELKEESYRIRHTVYSEELGWEPVNPKGLELDECDPYSFSVLLKHKRTGAFAGTVRLVIPPNTSPNSKLPFELHCADTVRKEVIDPQSLPRGHFGEISRLSVPSGFRRRLNEKNKPFVINDIKANNAFSDEERRNFPNIAIGLYLSVIAMVKMCNHSHMFVVVEPRLCRRLERLGLKFEQCGDELDHHGTRALFLLTRDNFTSNLNSEVLALFNLLEKQLIPQLALYPYGS